MIPVYAGHGKRKKEQFYSTFEDACEDMYQAIKKTNEENGYYSLMGHCLGALIALELCYMIRERKELRMPDHLFISGQGIPAEIYKEHCDQMDDKTLFDYLMKSGALDKEMCKEEFWDFVKILVLQPVKADAKLYDNYVFKGGREKLDLPVTILYGKNDHKYAAAKMHLWDDYFSKKLQYLEYDDGHFFIMNIIPEYSKDVSAIMHGKNPTEEGYIPEGSRLYNLMKSIEKTPMTASIITQIKLLAKEYGEKYLHHADEILRLSEEMGIDTSKISRKYIYDYLKQLDYFLKSGTYGHEEFSKIKNDIYDNETTMIDTYLPGLLLSYAYTTILYDKVKLCDDVFTPSIVEGGKGVEIGFGEGFYVWKLLSERKDLTMDGFDVSVPSIEFSTDVMKAENISADRWKLAYGNIFEGIESDSEKYDFGILAELIEHIPNPEIGIREVARILKPGGLLFLTTVMNSNHMDHITNFKSMDEVENMLKHEGFETVQNRLYKMTDDFPDSRDISQGMAFVCRKIG